jgi:hypothetical protein
MLIYYERKTPFAEQQAIVCGQPSGQHRLSVHHRDREPLLLL